MVSVRKNFQSSLKEEWAAPGGSGWSFSESCSAKAECGEGSGLITVQPRWSRRYLRGTMIVPTAHQPGSPSKSNIDSLTPSVLRTLPISGFIQ